MRAGHG